MPKLLTVEEVAGIFRKTERTIYTWLADKVFPRARKVKGGWLIPEQDVNRLFDQK